jgi:hypothetical protein
VEKAFPCGICQYFCLNRVFRNGGRVSLKVLRFKKKTNGSSSPADQDCSCQRSRCPPLLDNRAPSEDPCPSTPRAHAGGFTYELASGTPINPAGARSRVVIATELRSVGVHRIASSADIVAARGAAVVVVVTITTTTIVTFGIDRHCTGLPRLLKVVLLVVGSLVDVDVGS